MPLSSINRVCILIDCPECASSVTSVYYSSQFAIRSIQNKVSYKLQDNLIPLQSGYFTQSASLPYTDSHQYSGTQSKKVNSTSIQPLYGAVNCRYAMSNYKIFFFACCSPWALPVSAPTYPAARMTAVQIPESRILRIYSQCFVLSLT